MGRSVRWYPLMGKYVSTVMTGEVLLPQRQRCPLDQDHVLQTGHVWR
jgi:hypothetical protein